MSGKKSIPVKIALIFGGIISAIILLLVLLLFLNSILEFKPKPTSPVAVEGKASLYLTEDASLRIVTLNTGYGALGDNADFLFDGGSHLRTADKKRVLENMNSIIGTLKQTDADIIMVQETDIKATRSYYVNEYEMLCKGFPEMNRSFAMNFKLPYIQPLRTIQAGIGTLSIFPISSSERIQLPCPFSWPMRLINLKRCLLVSRIPVKNSDKELVIVNLHLEAYDSGEGKIAQTNQLRKFLQSEFDKGNYVIAGGDFNQTFSSVDLSRFPEHEGLWAAGKIEEEEFSSGWQFLMDSETPSCRLLNIPYEGADKENFQYYVIDGFIVSKNITVNSLKTWNKEFAATDHNPVVMDVTLNQDK